MTDKIPTLKSVSLLIEDCLHATAPTVDQGYPLIRTPNIGKGRLDLNGVFRVTEDTYEKWSRRAVPQDGDLILAREAPAGNVAIVKNGEKVCLGQRTVLIRPDPTKTDPDFLCYYLLAPKQQGLLLRGATGVTAAHVNMKDIRSLPLIDLPKLDYQKNVGAHLSGYDDLYENNRRRMELLEQAARLLFDEWFTRLRFPGHEHTPFTNGIPQGWERVPTPEAIEINPRTKLSDDEEHWYVEMGDLLTDSMVIQNAVKRDGRSGSKFRNGDTLLARITPCLENGKTGFVNFMFDGETGRGSTEFIVLRSKRVTPEFVYCLARSYHFRETAIKSMVGSSGRQRVQESGFEKHMVWIPPDTLLSLFREFTAPAFQQIKTLHSQNIKLRAARDLLLPRLMSGELTI